MRRSMFSFFHKDTFYPECWDSFWKNHLDDLNQATWDPSKKVVRFTLNSLFTDYISQYTKCIQELGKDIGALSQSVNMKVNYPIDSHALKTPCTIDVVISGDNVFENFNLFKQGLCVPEISFSKMNSS